MKEIRLLDPSDAGRCVGLTAGGLAYYDDMLRPLRTASGRRLYREDVIERFIAERDRSK
ncbi:MAG: hypothetical protein AB7N65_18895 [Vicinamibacterales bacterium]